jgi:hypothetical protein
MGPHQLEALADLSPINSDPFNITLTNAGGPTALGIAARLESHTVASLSVAPSSRPPASIPAARPQTANLTWLWISLLGVALLLGAAGLYVAMNRGRTSPTQFLAMQPTAQDGSPGARSQDGRGTTTSGTRASPDAQNAENLPVATDPSRSYGAGPGKKPSKTDAKDGPAKDGPAKDDAKSTAKDEAQSNEGDDNAEGQDKAASPNEEPESAGAGEAKVDLDEKPAPAEEGINRAAANAALATAAAAARACRSRGESPTGSGRAAVTFANDGSVAAVSLSQQFTGTAIGACVAAQFRQARAPAFSGDSATLFYPFDVPQ